MIQIGMVMIHYLKYHIAVGKLIMRAYARNVTYENLYFIRRIMKYELIVLFYCLVVSIWQLWRHGIL